MTQDRDSYEQVIERNPPRIKLSSGVNLLSERLGAKALLCSDDFFARMDNLIKDNDAIYIHHKYTEDGKWMDGWESRRKRTEGHDWCILRMGVPGVVEAFDLDTSFFTGNHAPMASVEGCYAPDCKDTPADLSHLTWEPLLKMSPLQLGSQNIYLTQSTRVFTHLRLNIFPDGGVARLRAYGDPAPIWQQTADDQRFPLRDDEVDLVSMRHGGKALLCSDMYFGDMNNLIAPGRARVMGEGWETRRSRRVGFDWIIVELGARGTVSSLAFDTHLFKGNFAESIELLGVDAHGANLLELSSQNQLPWQPILDRVTLQAHEERFFREEINPIGTISHVKLRVYPDGGVSRMRVYGQRSKVDYDE